MIAVLEPPVAVSAKPQPKDPIEELQQTVSASRLGLWLSCRLKFFFRYVLRIKKAPTPSMHAGSSVQPVTTPLAAAVTQIETVKTGLRDVIADLNATLDLLRAAEKEKKTSSKEVESVRATLRSLQKVAI